MDSDGSSSSSTTNTQESKQDSEVANDAQEYNNAVSIAMQGTQSTGCFLQVSQPSKDTTATSSESQAFQSFPSLNTFSGISSQPRTASLTTTTLPVWTHAAPRTQTLGGSSNQDFVSTNPSMFPAVVTTSTSVTTNPASFFVFSAPRAVNFSGRSAMKQPFRRTLHPRKQQFPLAMPTKDSFPTASSMFSSSPEPSTSAASKGYCFKPLTTPAGNVFSSVKTLKLPDTKGFKFNSYPSFPTEEKKNPFSWSLPASSRSTNENTFGLRGSLFNAIKNYPKENCNSSGQSSSHPNNRLPGVFVPPIDRDMYGNEYGRFQSITVMAEYSSKSFEEIRLEYYKMQQKMFVFGSSAFSFNSPYFFRSGNKENKELVHKEVQTSDDPHPDPVYAKGLFNEIWRIMECIICLDTVKTPIMQCESGHHFCNQCWSKVSVCPVCKRKKTNVRNYALESVFDKLPTPCKYHDEGCEAMVMTIDKERHESACCFQPFVCPVGSCMQKVDQKSLMSHCMSSHDVSISAVECPLDNRSYVWNSHNAELRKYICVFNLSQWGMFLLCHKEVEHTSCIWLQLLHSKDAKFMYEIQLSDTENFQSVSYKGPVTRLSFNAEGAKHKCLRISSELLFAMRSAAFQMKLEIWKKNFLPT